MKEKNSLLHKLISNLKENHPTISSEYKYIGTGSPNKNILIIGKEAAIKVGSVQYEIEINDNLNYWDNLSDFDTSKIPALNFNKYEALYPYKGQILKKDNGENWGTSKTWMNYQKLFNLIENDKENRLINFHEKSFLTEVNSTPSKITSEADTSSISFRKEHVLTSDFFQTFPIVIISGVGYFENTKKENEIEKIFGVKFSEKKFANKTKKSQPYWIHWNEEKTKIVINTHQLSIGISDLLLKDIAKEIINSNLLN